MLKRILAVFVTVITISSVICLTASAATIYGDANSDSYVNISDLVRMKKYISGNNIQINLESVDSDKDGDLDYADMTKLKKVLLGTERYQLSQFEESVPWLDEWN